MVVIIAAAVAAAQYYQSEKARGASKAALKKLEDDFKRLVPPKYNLSIMDPPEYIKASIPNPNFDMAEITPEQFKMIGKYKPEIAALVAEKRPDLVKETAGMKEGRQAQLDALRQLKRVSSERGDPEMQQAMAEAAQKSQIEAQSRSASVLQDAARRGTMGSGQALAATLQGQSDSMNRAAGSSRQAAVESYRNRLQALRDSASLGGQVRDSDMAMEGKNVDIINSFNERTSRNRQNWENNRAGTLNDGQRYNLDVGQRIADANVDQNNRARFSARDRKDDLLKYKYDNDVRERGYQNSLIDSEANWRRGERDNQNDLKTRQFDNDYRITAGAQGLAMEGIAQNTQTAQDRNQAIQGVGNGATASYLEWKGEQDQKAEDDERKKRYGEY